MIASLTGFLQSPHWFRIILGLFGYVFVLSIRGKYQIPFESGLARIPIICIIRDFLSFFVPIAGIIYLGDFLVLSLILFWVNAYTDTPLKDRGLVIGYFLVLGLLELLGQVFAIPGIMNLVQSLLLLILSVIVGVRMNNLTSYNTRDPAFIIQNRVAIFLYLAFPRALLAFAPNLEGSFVQYVLIPITFLPFFFILLKYQDFFHTQFIDQDQFNTTYINSLFDFMRTIGSAMNQKIEVKSILHYVVHTVVQHTDAEAGAVFLREESENELRLAVVEGYFPPPFPVPAIAKAKLSGVERYFENTPIAMGETVIGEIAAELKAIYIRNTSDDQRMEVNTQDDTLAISSFIGLPLIVNKELFGVLSIVNRTRGKFFSPLDFERFKIFAEYASLTLDSLYNYSQLLEKQEIEREVSIAGEIQTKLLPGRIPKAIRTKVAAFSKPAKGVSGDYYDIIPLTRTGKMGYVVCDVAGKGIPASLIMVMIRTIVHLVAGSTKDPSRVVTWINKGIAGSIDIERFATLSYFTYDPDTRELQYSNAAHHPLMIVRKDSRTIETLDSPGLPIGLERDAEYESRSLRLEPGDAVMVYTDGIVEAMNPLGEQYEDQRLSKVLLQHVHLQADELLEAIRTDIDNFVSHARQHDDQTMIIMKA
jgi:sigma-B regulation protein RsbU (phosphoserine phosphatase)